jgi:hypothetical protein
VEEVREVVRVETVPFEVDLNPREVVPINPFKEVEARHVSPIPIPIPTPTPTLVPVTIFVPVTVPVFVPVPVLARLIIAPVLQEAAAALGDLLLPLPLPLTPLEPARRVDPFRFPLPQKLARAKDTGRIPWGIIRVCTGAVAKHKPDRLLYR